MVSHDNLTYMAGCIEVVAPEVGSGGEERILSYLPLSHVAGLLMDVVAPMWTTARHPKGGWACVSFARPTDLAQMTLAERIKAVQPTVFLGVPRVWEKIRDRMIQMAAQNKPDAKTQKRIDGAKLRGNGWATNCQLGGTGQRPGACLEKVIDDKVYAKVRAKLGLSACKFAVTGAAPMDLSCAQYFGQLGININEMYGMSESTGATTVNSNPAHVWGTVGFAVPGAEVKIFRSGPDNDCSPDRKKEEADVYPSFANLLFGDSPSAVVEERYQGEVCFRGRHVMMGYMGNPDLGEDHVKQIQDKTKAAIDTEGWLHSGDKGAIDKSGMVRITGRFKEIIIPAGGENVSPIPIEEGVKKDPNVSALVSNVMMIGDKRKYCVAVVSLQVKGATGQEPGGEELTEPAKSLIQKAGGSATTVQQACDDATVIRLIGEAFAWVNKNPSLCPNSAASVKSFTIIPVDFSETGGQLTATLKLKRSVVEKEHECMVGSADSREGPHGPVGPGMSGYLYQCADQLKEVPGVGKCYGRYPPPGTSCRAERAGMRRRTRRLPTPVCAGPR